MIVQVTLIWLKYMALCSVYIIVADGQHLGVHPQLLGYRDGRVPGQGRQVQGHRPPPRRVQLRHCLPPRGLVSGGLRDNMSDYKAGFFQSEILV